MSAMVSFYGDMFRILGWVITCSLSVCLIGCGSNVSLPLPSASNIEKMTVNYHFKGKDREVNFTVPRKHYSAILASLQPAKKDKPNKCVVRGSIQISHDGNRKLTICFLSAQNGEAGYEITTTTKQYYFHGGTQEAIDDCIRLAYRDSLNKNE
jgi:hypothetical protein